MLNFNTSPYYDDFDPTKNFHRILFKPGYAVQARELTQSQTILQNQISNFASSIFSQNTPISGGQVTTNLNVFYLKLNTQYNGVNITASNFLNKVIQDTTGTILAKVVATAEASGGDPPTLIVSYISGLHFTDGSFLTPTDGTNIAATLINTGSTGPSSVASVASGVYYIVNGYSQSSQIDPTTGNYITYSIGNFVQVNPQTIILDKYDNTPSYRIGLEINETVIDYISDSSLLDPAVGASNYQAPGADRYQVSLSLITLPLQLGNDQGFIELVRVVNGQVVKQVDGTVYSTIDDYFAKRDYETNGDYIVNDFNLTPSPDTDSTKYDLTIGKGVAYVHGYRIENQSNLTLVSDRARTTANVAVNDVFIDYGTYYYVDTLNGFFAVDQMPSIDLHSVQANNIVTTSTNTYNSTKVGSAKIRNLVYVIDSGTANSFVYKAYVSDIQTTTFSGSVSSATTTTITINDTLGVFSTVANAYYGMTVSITSGTDTGDKRKIVSYNGSTKTFTVDTAFTVTPDTTTQFTIIPTVGNVSALVLPNGSSYTSSADINSQFGKVNGLSNGLAILENPGTPEMIFKVGNPYVASISGSTYVSTKTFSGLSTGVTGTFSISVSSLPLNFIGTAGSTIPSSVVKQNYTVINVATGQILDYTISGATVSLSSDKKTITFTSTSYTNLTVDVIATVDVINGDSYPVLKWKNLVTGNTTIVTTSPTVVVSSNTSVDLSLGQVIIQNATALNNKISLYVADVKRITKIYDTGSSSVQPVTSGLSSYTDVTSQYQLNNGQKDSYYDHASISLFPGANKAKGNLLVIFDYYSHINGTTNLGTGTAGDGYFSVESYLTSTYPDLYQNIPSYTATDGTTYKLADSIDFRPTRQNATTAFAFEFANGGSLMPQDLSQYQSSYNYYLGRKDKLILSKDKSFQIIEGTPSLNPIFPTEPDGSMVLATLTHDPYTAYVPGENPAGTPANLSINKVPHNRWAKSDITNLQTRVNNLEYYSSLSVLEQNAQSLQIPDVNGLNRFKNGILVDDFSSYATADTTNQDYAANINIRNQQLTALSIIDNFQLQNPVVLNSLGTSTGTNTYAIDSIAGTSTNIFTLPYTTSNVVTQPLASSTVSVNPFAVVVQQGIAKLNPPMDNWVDNSQAPALLITDPTMQVYQQTNGVNITNAGDFATIPGTSSTVSSSVSVINHGRFNGPFGGTVGYTATTTNTYASQLQNITTSGNYSPVSSTFSNSNGFLTNIAVLPYIRPQQIIFSAKGLLVNTPVSTWFDGTNVDQYIT